LALAKDSPLTRSVQAIDSILPLPVLGGCAAADQLALGQSGAPPGATCDIDATCRLKYPRNQRLKAEIRSGRDDSAIRRATIRELVQYLSKDLRDEAADLFRAAAFQFVCRYEETKPCGGRPCRKALALQRRDRRHDASIVDCAGIRPLRRRAVSVSAMLARRHLSRPVNGGGSPKS